ncbi:hypothetical protein OH77DRAFT_1401246 [Trametes cingulata]|nr:hypothetical protein OH77DRAFT_1401246 [Trametes cingulata]
MPVAAGPLADISIIAARNKAYPQRLWLSIACFVGMVALRQLLSLVRSRFIAQPRSQPASEKCDAEGRGAVRPTRQFSWSRLPAALVNHFRVLAFRNTVEVGEKYSFTYAEVFVTIAYIISLFTWTFINTTTVSGSALSPTYWSGRAGAMAVSQFPLITALGTKNNLLAYITGISYDKLNFVHRMTARVVFILLWIHAGSKIVHLTPESYQATYIRLGLTAVVAYTVLMVIAHRSIRSRLYELFFFSHFALVLVMLIGGYFHAKQVSTLAYYIWPSFVIWAFDRLLRAFRVVYYNNDFGTSRPRNEAYASVELLSRQFVRLRFTRPPQLKWTPGQAAFLIMPSVSTIPLEAHPFTIASVDSRYRLRGKAMERMDSTVTLVDQSRLNGTCETEELEFMISVRGGFTKRLSEVAKSGQKVKVLVDGPYGFSPDLRNDHTVVLVAGGSGISLVLSMFLGVVSDVQNGRSKCRKVVFVWSIRDAQQLEWISKAVSEALEVAAAQLEVFIRIFVTGRGPLPSHTESAGCDDASMYPESELPTAGAVQRPLHSFPAVRIAQGRPDLGKLLKDEVSTAAGRMSVTVCGSQAIAKACRDALRIPFTSTLYGGPSVVLYVESFGYA